MGVGMSGSGSNPVLQRLLQKRSRGADGRDAEAEDDGELGEEEQPDAANTFLVRMARNPRPRTLLTPSHWPPRSTCCS